MEQKARLERVAVGPDHEGPCACRGDRYPRLWQHVVCAVIELRKVDPETEEEAMSSAWQVSGEGLERGGTSRLLGPGKGFKYYFQCHRHSKCPFWFPLLTLKIKQPVILPAKCVCVEIAENCNSEQASYSKTTVGKSGEQRRGVCLYLILGGN